MPSPSEDALWWAALLHDSSADPRGEPPSPDLLEKRGIVVTDNYEVRMGARWLPLGLQP